jgi:streptogramin lyase
VTESGTAKIGRLDPNSGRFSEFATPTANSRPISGSAHDAGAIGEVIPRR